MTNHVNFEHITAKIFIKKFYFFRIFKRYVFIIIVPSLKIAKIKTNITNLPFKELTFLNMDELVTFCKNGNYEISFTTKNAKLKRILDCYFK